MSRLCRVSDCDAVLQDHMVICLRHWYKLDSLTQQVLMEAALEGSDFALEMYVREAVEKIEAKERADYER